MDKVEVKVTWRLAWGLWWRMLLIGLGLYAIIAVIALIVGAAAIIPFLS
jgi:hypothetical protein